MKERPAMENVEGLAKEWGVSELFVEMCLQRGLDTQEKINAYLEPDVTHFHDPFLIYDMERVVERIHEALMNDESITIYGDYDADGMTSTALLLETLENIGARVDYYIPNRFDEGYGPNVEAFQAIINSGTHLIITVDNGVHGHEAIDVAMSQGVDVIVTDHHELPEELPQAYAIIHPAHPEGNYPFKALAGVGVALKLAAALLEEIPFEAMDLAAIGTVADLVPLVDENRAIVQWGLASMQESQRLGILALLQVAGTSPQEVDASTIGFRIAPRLNAAGRMADAGVGVELLTSQDTKEAKTIAEELNQLNEERKKMVDQMSEAALSQINNQKEHRTNFVGGEDWHKGVIGIVASRLVEATGKPSFVYSVDSATGIATASSRSVGEFNLYEALHANEKYFEKYGGHHMAAGMSFKVERVAELQSDLNEYISDKYTEEDMQQQLWIDAEINPESISVDFIKSFQKFAPFGQENEEPVFKLKDVQALDMRKIGSNQQHLKARFSKDGSEVDSIAFQKGDLFDRLGSSPIVDVVGRLDINEWNGNVKPQMIVEDLKTNQMQVIDERYRKIPDNLFKQEDAAFVFYNKKSYQDATLKFEGLTAYLINNKNEANQLQITASHIVFVDCPSSEVLIQPILKNHDFSHVSAVFFSYEDVYYVGLASREDFAKVFKFLNKYPVFDYNKNRIKLAEYLELNLNLLNHVIFTFLEVGYVKLEHGILYLADEFKQVNLMETQTYKEREGMMLMEEKLLLSSIDELTVLLNNWANLEA